jgi:hypothetical protein
LCASHAAAYVSIEPAIPNDGGRCSGNGGLGDEQQKIGLDRQSILANSLVVAASNIDATDPYQAEIHPALLDQRCPGGSKFFEDDQCKSDVAQPGRPLCFP